MKKPFLIATSLTLVVLIAFVYFSQPIKAKADQPALTYETTTYSLSDVKAMITGMEAALIPIVFIVIGFLALTYCTLRNVNVPIQYSSGASFIDKCSELGHYCFDNATDALKPVLYSVYEFVASGQIVDPNAISSTLPFIITSVSRFFSSFSAWIGSSLIYDVSDIGSGLVELFDTLNFHPNFYPMGASVAAYWPSDVTSIYNLFYFAFNQSGISNYIEAFEINPDQDFTNKCIVFSNGISVMYQFNPNNNTLDRIMGSQDFIRYNTSFRASDITTPVSSALTVTKDFQWSAGNYANENNYFSNGYFSTLWQQCLVYGLNVYFYDSFPDSIPIDDAQPFVDQDVITPWSDQLYHPTDDVIDADIDDVANKLGEGATIGSLAALIALLTQDKALTLGTAITDVQTINSAGDYNFPSMDNIWKYPQYFFDMLHGWGTFVKGCLNAVTVGEGGLSWLFYGGFVLLICGGIIGKILLG